MGNAEIKEFLTSLAVRHVSASTQNQALAALLFLYRDVLRVAVGDLNASRGVIFSTNGFQEGAVLAAKSAAIELFRVRELTDEEWGLPGRVVDFYLQVIQGSFGNPILHNPKTFAQGGTDPAGKR